MAEPDRPHEADQEWIKPLLTAAAGGIAVGPVARDELIAAGRARLARRRVLAGTALTAVLAFALGGYAVAEGIGAVGRAGHVAVTVSATSGSAAAATPTVATPDGTRPAAATPAVDAAPTPVSS